MPQRDVQRDGGTVGGLPRPLPRLSTAFEFVQCAFRGVSEIAGGVVSRSVYRESVGAGHMDAED